MPVLKVSAKTEEVVRAAEILSEHFPQEHPAIQGVWHLIGQAGCVHELPENVVTYPVANVKESEGRETQIAEANWIGVTLFYGTASRVSRIRVTESEQPPKWATFVHMTEEF